MKHLRTILWMGLALVLLLNFQTWNAEFGPRDAAAAAAAAEAAKVQDSTNPLSTSLPTELPTSSAATQAASSSAPAANPAPTALPPGPILNVRTDVLDVDINLRGGELRRADLLEYRVTKGEATPVRLLRGNGNGDEYLLQTGLMSAGGANNEAFPTHNALFTCEFKGFVLDSSLDELRVPLKWTSPEGIEVTKTLVFHRGSYRIDVEYEVKNPTAAAWSATPYAQILHDKPVTLRSMSNYFNTETYSFTGPVYWDGKKYTKLKIANKEDAALNREVSDGWLASLEHHFVTAVVPSPGEKHRFTLQVRGQQYLARDRGPAVTVAAGSTGSIKQTLFVGPKLHAQLKPIHPELERAADFGVLNFLSQPLFMVLSWMHKFFNNWGLAIIAVTILLKLVLYPFSEASGRSMAKMKLVAPRMKQLQETYKDDRAKLGQAMMELYKKEKVNPAAGCLPQLLQIPVFMAFYWVLLESVEMRQAPFFGWLQDLSSRDHFFILPLIMAGAMFLQFKMSPPPADPAQAKVMMIMPVLMSVTFAFLPSGLVLYYAVNTLLTVAQQWNISRRIEASANSRN